MFRSLIIAFCLTLAIKTQAALEITSERRAIAILTDRTLIEQYQNKIVEIKGYYRRTGEIHAGEIPIYIAFNKEQKNEEVNMIVYIKTKYIKKLNKIVKNSKAMDTKIKARGIFEIRPVWNVNMHVITLQNSKIYE